MLVDRIVANTLAFINTLLWWRARKVDKRPYEKIGQPIRGDIGQLQRIRPILSDPRQPDRHVDYWIFMPSPLAIPKGMKRVDIHICCSWLGTVPNSSRSSAAAIKKEYATLTYTHQIDVLEASHFVDKKTGKWRSRQIHSSTHDLIGNRSTSRAPSAPPLMLRQMPWLDSYRDGFAVQVTASLAARLLSRSWWEVSWEEEIELNRKEVMRSAYTQGRIRFSKVKRIQVRHNRIEIDE